VAGPGSTARDVHRLMLDLRDRVRDRFGMDLEPEVHVVGTVG
jgi:UDP-N-acetylenolpyruvoylglucosamine reductase